MTNMSSNDWNFHPVVQKWFDDTYQEPTACQARAWSAIQKNRNVLVSAPTGSGKTLAAFLTAIDELVRQGLENGRLADQTQIVYVSPLKALSYDIERNLQEPLAGIRDKLAQNGSRKFEIRVGVRTGDTPQSQRQKMARKPPHILVTTPESLYLLLTAVSGRNMLHSVRRLIVDEIHALVNNKRGAHFSLSVARLQWLTGYEIVKTGLSATQKPLERIASFLTGHKDSDCEIVDTGHVRNWDIGIELPPAPLEAVMSAESWTALYQRIAALIKQHQTTLIFVNTRRHAERATRHLAELVGDEDIASHHGSLSKEHRHNAEQRLKSGSLRALVATASLELGIDIGDIDLVCQICSPRSISVFLQRVGRSGHSVGQVPKGRVFPTTRDELVEAAALVYSANQGDLESLHVVSGAVDVLSQQIVAEASVRDCSIDELYSRFTTASAYWDLSEDLFHKVLMMLSEGFSLQKGRRGAYLHLDAVNKMIRARKGARIVAATNAGAIPDLFDYDVVLEPDDIRIGTVNEDFAFESLPGDIFQLGNASYRVLRVEKGYVRVADAEGLPPNIPFWLGEGRGRSDELSDAVSALRSYVADRLETMNRESLCDNFKERYRLDACAAEQIVDYLTFAHQSLNVLPTKKKIVLERFFDETGDTHLVVHSVFGSRLNRAWGLALRKRFCVRFDFELQAAALEDSFVLSLGPTHSFALCEVQDYVKSSRAFSVLEQAVLGAPMFATRWRWVCNTALAVLRFRAGAKVPPPFQRNDSQDLLSLVFPAQLACQENITGPIEIPDHPLVVQTLTDCMHELMDSTGLQRVLSQIERGDIKVYCKDTPQPSALAQEILTAKPYAFLDDAPAEERRTLAVQSRRYGPGGSDAGGMNEYDFDLVGQMIDEAWPKPRDAEEVHDALVHMGFICDEEISFKNGSSASRQMHRAQWKGWIEQLTSARRVTGLQTANGKFLWTAAERLDEMIKLHPDAEMTPPIASASLVNGGPVDFDQALVSVIRARMETIGPCTARQIASSIDLPPNEIERALLNLESEGTAMRGDFVRGDGDLQWCDRKFLARIHKRTITALRSQIKPAERAQFIRFLCRWMRLNPETMGEGTEALATVLSQLEGFEANCAVWESDILASRIYGYMPEMLDFLSASGKVVWCRLSKPGNAAAKSSNGGSKIRYRGSIKSIPLTFVARSRLSLWRGLADNDVQCSEIHSSVARQITETLDEFGHLFFDELLEYVNQLPGHVESALVELFALGAVTCDHFGGVRSLLTSKQHQRKKHRLRRKISPGVQASGRWSLLNKRMRNTQSPLDDGDLLEYSAEVLLRRYGVVFRELLTREGRFMPAWTSLLPVFRRMEDRGFIRGGRFVAGVSGEQFALPQAVDLLRDTGRQKASGKSVTIHAADPLNLTGVIYKDVNIAASSSKYFVYRDGELIAAAGSLQPRQEYEELLAHQN